MTVTKRYHMELSDILAIRITCKKADCMATVSIPMKNLKNLHVACHNCGTHILPGDEERNMIQSLLYDVDYLVKRKNDAAYKLELEFNLPSETPTSGN